MRNQLSYIKLILADQKNSHSILKLVSQEIYVSINQFRDLPIHTKHPTLGCITELTCSNVFNSNLLHRSFTPKSFPPKVCRRTNAMPSECLSTYSPWSPCIWLPPKCLSAEIIVRQANQLCQALLRLLQMEVCEGKGTAEHPPKLTHGAVCHELRYKLLKGDTTEKAALCPAGSCSSTWA